MKRHAPLDEQESPLRTYLIPPQDLHDDEIGTHVESGDEEFSVGLNFSLQETQVDHHEEENPSERSQNRSSFSSLPFVFENYEPSLDSDELAPEKARLKAVEKSWRNVVRWTYLSRLGHRILYFLFLKHFASSPETENLDSSHSGLQIEAENSEPSSSETLSASILLPEHSETVTSSEEEPQFLIAETDSQPESEDSAETSHSSPSHLWLHGRAFPLDGKDLRRVLAVNVAIEETEKVLIEGIHTLFGILVVSQVFYSIKNHTDFAKIFNIIFTSGDGNSIRDLYQIGSPVPHADGLWAFLALPFAWGTFKGVNTYYRSEKEDLQRALETLEKLPVGFYHDNIRWFLPCLAVEHAFHELTEALLFEKELPSAEKRNILKSLDVFAQRHGGRSRMFAYHTFYNVADGVSIRNFSALSESTQEELLQEKALALQCLMKGAHHPHKSLSNLIPAFYARYLLWTLGQCKGLAENVFFLGLRTAKTALTVLLFKTIIQGIIDILNCPQQQGQTWTGPAAWSSDYTYTCFQAYMNAFNNPIPGQPIETLTSLFPQFHLPSVIDMDLSGKGLTGTIISEILTAFVQSQPNVQIQVLNLSNNGIGTISSSGTVALAEIFKYLPFLQVLDLSNNYIGSTDSNGTVVLAESLRYLTQLQSLDLSYNPIDYIDSKGTLALAKSLRSLAKLKSLDLSSNAIGYQSFNGTVALAENLKYLTQLQSLNFSNNAIGKTDSNGTVALAESLPALRQLQSLDLSNNLIGNTDSNGVVALAKNLPSLSQLRSLRLSNNFIAASDESIISSLMSSLLSLKEISTLFIVAQTNGVLPYNFSLALQHNFNLPSSQTDIYIIQSADAMASYLSSLSLTLQQLDLSNRVISTVSIMSVIGQYFANFTSLLSLNLSNTQIGFQSSTVVLAVSLPFLTQLQSLDLSNNDIGTWDSSDTIALAESLPFLTQLQSLDLSNNWIGYTNSKGTVALAESLPYLTQLQLLDLSANEIGYTDSTGTVALAESLRYLTQLKSLDLSNTFIGHTNSNGTVALAENLRYLTKLETLDLSSNSIGWTDYNGTVALAGSLRYLTQLQSLDLSNIAIGSTDSNGISALLSALAALTQHSLTALSLADMQNIVWTQAANDLEVFINRQLQSSCESQLCHGGSVSRPTIRPRTRSFSSSDHILSENTLPKEKPSRASKFSQKILFQPEPDQSLDSLEEKSFVTSSASSLQPPLVLTFIPHLLSKLSHTVSDWWKKPSLPPVQETLLEASPPSSPSPSSFSLKPSSQQSSFSESREGVKLTSFNACQAGGESSIGYNLCETQPPVFNACVVKPSIMAPSLESIFLLGSFVWNAFISPERQEKIIDWTVPFPEHLKNNIDHKLNRVADILQARSSKISPDALESYAWSLDDLNNLFSKHYDHSTIFLSELMDFQDELDHLLLQLTRFERNSEKHRLEKQFYDGILGCYKDLKALPPLVNVLKEKLSEEDFEKYEKKFQRFVEILFDFEMRGKRAKTNKWMKRFKTNLSTFTCEITEEVGKVTPLNHLKLI